jgi:hypothetical protein
VHRAPEIHSHHELIWPSVFILLCLIMLTVIKARAFPRVLRIVQSTFSNQILQQLEREEMNSLKFYSLALNFFFSLNLAFLLYKVNSMYRYVLPESSDLVQFLFFFMLILLLLGFKIIVNKLVAFFTGETRLISDYLTNSVLVNQTFGLLLFPMVVLLQFTDLDPFIFIWGSVLVLVFAMLLKWYRGIIMGLVEERIGLLQIFSYFCGLEILPVIVMVKYVVETF